MDTKGTLYYAIAASNNLYTDDTSEFISIPFCHGMMILEIFIYSLEGGMFMLFFLIHVTISSTIEKEIESIDIPQCPPKAL